LVRRVVDAPPFKKVVPVNVEDDCETKPDWKVWSAVHVLAAESETPEPTLRHVPFTAKHPLWILNPPPEVEVAAVARLRAPAIVVEPVLETRKRVVVALPVVEPMVKRSRFVSPYPPKMVSLAFGVVVPIPTAVPVSIIDELLKENVVPFHFGTKLVVRLLIVEEPSFPAKLVQSVEERQPLIEPEAVRQLSELLANERPLPMEAEVTAPVPLPERMPPKVVDAVPPCATPRVPVMKLKPTEVVATTCPSALVERSEFVSEVR
jgi:hypothetical protein